MTGRERLPVIVNRSGGTAAHAGDELGDRIEAAFAAADSRIALELVDGQGIAAALERHAGAGRLVVGGGDGTIGGAAHFAAGSDSELAILPLGTRNHFARQLGLPLDLAEAARLAAHGTASAIDLGEAGGRTFVNNASAGAYVELVREREASSLPKLPASILAALHILLRLRPLRYDLCIDGERCDVVTPMLFVGNNRYEIAEGHPGERDSLSDGHLSVFALAPLSPLALTGLALRTLVGRPDMRRDFALDRLAREIAIEGRDTDFAIALDGETCRLPLPLRLAARPGALRVVTPPKATGGRPGSARRSARLRA